MLFFLQYLSIKMPLKINVFDRESKLALVFMFNFVFQECRKEWTSMMYLTRSLV